MIDIKNIKNNRKFPCFEWGYYNYGNACFYNYGDGCTGNGYGISYQDILINIYYDNKGNGKSKTE